MARIRTTLATPLRSDRLRRIDSRGFAFLLNAYLQDGFFSHMTPPERSLYLLYVLLGDRNGVSFHSHVNIAALIGFGIDEYLETRESLIRKDLIAVAELGTRVQVLSLPDAPVLSRKRSTTPSTATTPNQTTPVDADPERSIAFLRDILRDLNR